METETAFEQAAKLAAELHRKQIRKGSGIPYITHLMSVAGLAMEASVYCDVGSTSDIGIGALLHDAIEDQSHQITLAQIEERFGVLPAVIVKDCTDTDVIPKPPWKVRKQDYIDSINAKGRASQLVSTADKLHNARAIVFDHGQLGHTVFDRFSASPADVVWYYQSLAREFEQSWQENPLVSGLNEAVEKLSKLAVTS